MDKKTKKFLVAIGVSNKPFRDSKRSVYIRFRGLSCDTMSLVMTRVLMSDNAESVMDSKINKNKN